MKNLISISATVLIALFIHSCRKDKPQESAITTVAVTEISYTSATAGGEVTSQGGAPIISKGLCWGTNSNPTISDSKTTEEGGSGTFTCHLTQLALNTLYYVRAYATNSDGTSYGNQVTFTTLKAKIPVLISTGITSLTMTSAIAGGNISADNGAAVTARGVCWGTSANPTTSDNKTTDGGGNGIFVSNITGLTANTIYHARAYATNSAGTAYGNQVDFKTYVVADIDNNYYHAVTIGAQTWLAENLKTTKFKNGTTIPQVFENMEWNNLTTPAYCWIYNDISYKNGFGALYNWYAVSTGNLCPAGWHVPSDVEWTALFNSLGGTSGAANKLKETGTTHWMSPNGGSTNESGFTAVGAGNRGNNGLVGNIEISTYFWHSIEVASYAGQVTYLQQTPDAYIMPFDKAFGASVRCIKD
jgi:uncharacterized protein (TIGR02145 family)